MLHIVELKFTHEPHELLTGHLHVAPFPDCLRMVYFKVFIALVELQFTLFEFLEGRVSKLFHLTLKRVKILEKLRQLLDTISGHDNIFKDIFLDKWNLICIHLFKNCPYLFLELLLHIIDFIISYEIVMHIPIIIVLRILVIILII